jgi:hypothetical protein
VSPQTSAFDLMARLAEAYAPGDDATSTGVRAMQRLSDAIVAVAAWPRQKDGWMVDSIDTWGGLPPLRDVQAAPRSRAAPGASIGYALRYAPLAAGLGDDHLVAHLFSGSTGWVMGATHRAELTDAAAGDIGTLRALSPSCAIALLLRVPDDWTRDVVQKLYARARRLGVRISDRGQQGCPPPLHLATACGDPQMIDALYGAGLDDGARDASGRDAGEYAAALGNLGGAARLQSLRARSALQGRVNQVRVERAATHSRSHQTGLAAPRGARTVPGGGAS